MNVARYTLSIQCVYIGIDQCNATEIIAKYRGYISVLIEMYVFDVVDYISDIYTDGLLVSMSHCGRQIGQRFNTGTPKQLADESPAKHSTCNNSSISIQSVN